jgi:hypothetical protein
MCRLQWKRVCKARPCPVCGRPEWCFFAGNERLPSAAICVRVESAKRCGEAGWIHRLRDDGGVWSPTNLLIFDAEAGKAELGGPMERMAERCRHAAEPEKLERLASDLGVSVETLRRLSVGWYRYRGGCWSFPMRRADGAVVGIRLYKPDRSTMAVKGGCEGLFLPTNTDLRGRLFITEGPINTAALLNLGFAAVGRPSYRGGSKLLTDLVRRLAVPDVVIVSDGDASSQRGAADLAAKLAAYCPIVRIITPPSGVRSARAWKRAVAKAPVVRAPSNRKKPRRHKADRKKPGQSRRRSRPRTREAA